MIPKWLYRFQKKIRYSYYGSFFIRLPFVIIKKSGLNIPEHIYKHLPYKGVIKVKISENKSFKMLSSGHKTENELYWEGLFAHESESIKEWIKYVKESEVIMDIGANAGVFSLVAASVNKQAEIYAFEPLKRMVTIFEKNCRLNPKFNIRLQTKAVGAQIGETSIYDPGGEAPTSASLSSEFVKTHMKEYGSKDWKSYRVEVTTIDAFKKENKINKIDLVKIDVEGFEGAVISGMHAIIEHDKPVILMESLDWTENKKYKQYLMDHDYSLQAIADKEDRNILCIPNPSDKIV